MNGKKTPLIAERQIQSYGKSHNADLSDKSMVATLTYQLMEIMKKNYHNWTAVLLPEQHLQHILYSANTCSSTDVAPFSASPEEQRSHKFGPVSSVTTYVDRTGCFRRSKLFVSWAGPHRVKHVTKQLWSRWVIESVWPRRVKVCKCLEDCKRIQPGVGPCSRGFAIRSYVLQQIGPRCELSSGFIG